MHINLVSLFPEWFDTPLSTALLGKAAEAGLVSFARHNPRDLTLDPHHTVDDRPYGGGPGMVMLADPLVRQLRQLGESGEPEESGPPEKSGEKSGEVPQSAESEISGKVRSTTRRTLVMSASGRPFTQAMARELAEVDELTLVCGRYEGIDARVEALCMLEPVSVGEAVLNGGEAAALMIIEAVTRLIPGFMGKLASGEEESFSAGLLEYPHYTRPETFEGLEVPEVLRSGDHQRIAAWRREQSLAVTWQRRPDMLDTAPLSATDLLTVRNLYARDAEHGANTREHLGRSLYLALLHYPVLLERTSGGREKCGATSLTNLDVHDIARCSRTYGLASFFVVTPLEDQQRLLETLRDHWTHGAGGRSNPDRAAALELVHGVADLEGAIAAVTCMAGQRPLVLGTSARQTDPSGKAEREQLLTPPMVRDKLRNEPVLLVLGTGHGLAAQILEQCDAVMRPVRWLDEYNHLPVRGAAAVILDRILGDRH